MARKIKIVNVVGARPNFIKIAPVIRQMCKVKNIEPMLVHTGQHYDKNMSDIFFKELMLPKPDLYLNASGTTQLQQIADIMVKLENALVKLRPQLVIVVGDVSSTLAAALAAVKLNIPVAHIEAGLRSFDRSMPEEINRILTDAVSDYLFTTCKDANFNLIKEGVDKKKIFFAGNVMIDTLNMLKPKINNIAAWQGLKLKKQGYALLTLHRPSNVDDKSVLENILKTMVRISKVMPVVFSVHPRTQKIISDFKMDRYIKNVNFKYMPPQGYLDFLSLMQGAKMVLTDSGGIQEETTVLGVPCLTLRKNTERPITVTQGTNTIVGNNMRKLGKYIKKIINNDYKTGKIPELWDGNAAVRIVNILTKNLR